MSETKVKRRIRLIIEAESTIEIDEEKYVEFLGEYAQRGVKAQQTRIEGMIDGSIGDYYTRDDVARTLGTDEGYDKFHDTVVNAEIEEHCAKHDVWYAIDPSRLASCWMCNGEKRGRKKKS